MIGLDAARVKMSNSHLSSGVRSDVSDERDIGIQFGEPACDVCRCTASMPLKAAAGDHRIVLNRIEIDRSVSDD